MHRRFALRRALGAKLGPRRALRYLAGLLLVLLAASALPAAAQDQPPFALSSPFTVTVNAGFDGRYRVYEWFPVQVDIANSGPDVQAELEWQYPGVREQTFRSQIDLPRGARKRISLNVFSQDFARIAQLRLFSGGRELLRQDVDLAPIDTNIQIFGVVSSDAGLFNGLNGQTLANGAEISVQHIDLTALPLEEPALRTLNVLVLHDIDSTALTPEQLATLELWLQMGGQLIVSGGANAGRTSAAVADLLPVELSGSVTQGSLGPLNRLIVGSGQLGDTALSAIQSRPGTFGVPSGPEALLWVRRIGAGRVIFSAFDLTALRGWNGEARLWQRILLPNNFFAPGLLARQRNINLLEDMLRLPTLIVPSTLTLLGFLAVYIAAVGPLHYLVLRRLRRLEWAWLTLPLTVLGFATVFYMVGFNLRGNRALTSQMSLVQSSEGQTSGIATSYTGLFSPRRTSYSLGFPSKTLVHEALSWSSSGFDSIPEISSDGSSVIPNVLVDVGSVRTFMSEAPVELPVSVSSDFTVSGGSVAGEIRNTSGVNLEDAVIISGESFVALDSLNAGETATFNFSTGLGNFPWGVVATSSSYFNRQQIFTRLFINDQSSSALEGRNVYLLAWASRATLPTTVNGQPSEVNGDTLYMIQLNPNSAAQPSAQS